MAVLEVLGHIDMTNRALFYYMKEGLYLHN